MYTSRNNRSDNRSLHRRDFGKSGGSRQMFKAVCSSCGKACEVPFMPSGNKPVYCSECFNKQPDNVFKPRFEDRVSSAQQPHNGEQLNTIITKLDKIITLLSSCSNDSCCQKETPQTIQEKPVKEKVGIPVEKKVKASKTSKK